MPEEKSRVTVIIEFFKKNFKALTDSQKAIVRMTAAITAARVAFGLLRRSFFFAMRALSGVTREFMELEHNLISTSAMLNASAREVDRFTSKIVDMSTRTGYAATKLSRAFFDIASAQIPVGYQMEFLEKSAQLARIGMSDLNTAVKLGVRVFRSFHLEQKDLNEAFNAMYTAQKLGVTTIHELGQSFGMVSGMAANMNMTYKETLGILATLTQLGLKTTTASMGLRNILNQLLSPGRQVEELLAAMGYQTGQNALENRGLVETLIRLQTSLKNNNKEFSDVFTNMRGMTAVSTLANDEFDTMLKNMIKMNIETENLEKGSELAATGMKKNWEELKAGVTAVGTDIIQKYSDVINAAITTGKALTTQHLKLGWNPVDWTVNIADKLRRSLLGAGEQLEAGDLQKKYEEITENLARMQKELIQKQQTQEDNLHKSRIQRMDALKKASIGFSAVERVIQNKRLSSAVKLANYLIQIEKQAALAKVQAAEGTATALAWTSPLTALASLGVIAGRIAPIIGIIQSIGGITGSYRLQEGGRVLMNSGVVNGSLSGDRVPAMVGHKEAVLDSSLSDDLREFLSMQMAHQQQESSTQVNLMVDGKDMAIANFKNTNGLVRDGVLNEKDI